MLYNKTLIEIMQRQIQRQIQTNAIEEALMIRDNQAFYMTNKENMLTWGQVNCCREFARNYNSASVSKDANQNDLILDYSFFLKIKIKKKRERERERDDHLIVNSLNRTPLHQNKPHK